MHRQFPKDANLGVVDRLFIKGEKEQSDFNRRMFDEDFSDIFCNVGRHGERLFEIASNDQELTERLLQNVETRYGRHRSDQTVREWLEDIAGSLIGSGVTYYFLSHGTERENIRIAPFGSSGVVRLFGKYFQWVPKRTERHWDRDDEEIPREIRIFDSRKMMRFELPTTIRRMLVAQNRTLAVLDRHQFGIDHLHPKATHEDPDPTNYFDFSIWRDAQEHALYRSTRATGWNGRKYDSAKQSDFFDCHRLIRFRRNQLLLRDDILRQLSAELSWVGKSYNSKFSVKISVAGELPNVSDLNELEARLTRENAGFTEVVNYCFKR